MSTTFTGTAWVPPKPAPLGLVLFASLFDRIAIVCDGPSCKHQLPAWPAALQPHVRLIDGAAINGKLGITNVDDHGYKVTQGHAGAWELLSEEGVSSVLVLEDDYTPLNSTVAHFVDKVTGKPSASLAGVKDFLKKDAWGMLRLGYNPIGQAVQDAPGGSIFSFTECPAACKCAPSPYTANVCSVSLPSKVDGKHCDVRSFVAYAVHKSLQPSLTAFAHASFDNFSMYLGMLSQAETDYTGPPNAMGYSSTPQDLYFPATVDPLHYFTPGLLYQQDKPMQVVPMSSFGELCNPASKKSGLGAKGGYTDGELEVIPQILGVGGGASASPAPTAERDGLADLLSAPDPLALHR